MGEKAMTLRECARFDHANGAKSRLTGWGIICKERHEKKISRKQRRLMRQRNG
jgi:hypothetical protein